MAVPTPRSPLPKGRKRAKPWWKRLLLALWRRWQQFWLNRWGHEESADAPLTTIQPSEPRQPLPSPTLPKRSLAQREKTPAPLPVLKGLEDLPELAFWSTQDLLNAIEWTSPRDGTHDRLGLEAETLSLQSLAQGFADSPSPIVSPPVRPSPPIPPNTGRSLVGLETLDNLEHLTMAELLAALIWEPESQTASEEDLNLLGDLLSSFPT